MNSENIIKVVRRGRGGEDDIAVAIDCGKKFLPSGYKFDEQRGLFQDDRLISNFLFYPKEIIEEISVPEMKANTIVLLDFVVAGTSGVVLQSVTFDLKQLLRADFQVEVDSRLCLEADFKESEKSIRQLLRCMISKKTPVCKYQLTRLGWFCVNGIRGYNAGSKIIGELENLNVTVSPDLMRYDLQALQVEDSSAQRKIGAYLKDYFELYPGKSPLVFSYLVLGLLRSLFNEAGLAPKFCMFLVGENQSFKTTVATYGCALYNRLDDVETHLHNLTGSEARLMQILEQEKDSVAIIDDLNRSDSLSNERMQERKISNLIRVSANNIGRENMLHQYEINAQVMFCGEYALKNASTNNRLIVINFERGDISKDKLTSFERNAGLQGVFVEDFLKWCTERYDSVMKMIKYRHERFRSERDGEMCYQERLATNYHFLELAYGIAYDYFKDRGIEVGINQKQFCVMLENNMEAQIEQLEMDGKEREDYVMMTYYTLYMEECERVFKKKPKNNIWWGRIYYNKGKDLMCIPSSELSNLVECYSGKSVGASAIANQFEMLGLLERDENKQGCRTKKVFGKRSYCIRYGEWTEYVQENYTQQGTRC